MSTGTHPDFERLCADIEELKRTKQNIIAAGGNSSILTRGTVDGELSTLYRKDAINSCRPDTTSIPSEPAVVAYVEDRVHAVLQQTKRMVSAATSNLEKLINEERTRATMAETELRTMIGCINVDGLKNLIAAETERATGAETKLRQRIRDEKDRAVAAEANLGTSLEREIARASEEEGKLAHSIADEVSRAKEAEKAISDRQTGFDNRIVALSNDIVTEKNRAEAAEKGLDTKYTALIENLQQMDNQLRTDLLDEASRASGAESAIIVKLNAEIERAKSEEARLENLVSGLEYDDQIQALKEHVLVHEGIITQRVADEVDRAIAAESELRANIINETERSVREDEMLNKAIGDEVTRATAEEAKIKEDLRQEITRSLSRDDTLDGKIAAEIERATRVEDNLYERLSDVSTQNDAELDTIHGEVTALDKKLTDEIARSTKEDNDLWDAISAETTRASSAEAANAASIAAEVTRAKDVESGINHTLVDEIERSVRVDRDLDEAIRAEVSRATLAEGQLNEEIVHERTRAIAEEEKIRRELKAVEDATVRKDVAGEDGMIVQDASFTFLDSPTGDKNAKQMVFFKKLLSLATGAVKTETEQYDLGIISGSHDVGVALAAEVLRATAAEDAIRKQVEDGLAGINERAIDKEMFKNNGYRVMSSQEIHTEPDAYGSQMWIRSIIKNVNDENADETRECHITSDDLRFAISSLDQNDTLMDVSVNKANEKEVADLLDSIFGVFDGV